MPALSAVRLAFVVCVAALAVLTLGPFQDLLGDLEIWDKAAHFGAFYTLAALAFVGAPGMRRTDLVVILVLGGAALEVLQSLVGRDGEVMDVAADTAGVLAVYLPSGIQPLRTSLRKQAVPLARRRSDRPRRAPGREAGARSSPVADF